MGFRWDGSILAVPAEMQRFWKADSSAIPPCIDRIVQMGALWPSSFWYSCKTSGEGYFSNMRILTDRGACLHQRETHTGQSDGYISGAVEK